MYNNRTEAGVELAGFLDEYRKSDAVVLGIPRGGAIVAARVACKLGLPLEVILTKKLSHPLNNELAIGAIGLDGDNIPQLEGIDTQYLQEESERVRDQLEQRKLKYYGDYLQRNLRGRIAVIIDDGLATGHTMLAAIDEVKKSSPAKIVVAVPVSSPQAESLLKEHPDVDKVICRFTPENFQAIENFYMDFAQTTDEEVVKRLREARRSVSLLKAENDLDKKK